MSRVSNKQIKKSVLTEVVTEVVVPVAYEEFIAIQEFKIDRHVIVTVGLYDSNDNQLDSNQYRIADDYYDLLMSESPDFAVGKPKNEYREADLFYVLDLISTTS